MLDFDVLCTHFHLAWALLIFLYVVEKHVTDGLLLCLLLVTLLLGSDLEDIRFQRRMIKLANGTLLDRPIQVSGREDIVFVVSFPELMVINRLLYRLDLVRNSLELRLAVIVEELATLIEEFIDVDAEVRVVSFLHHLLTFNFSISVYN